MMEAASTDGNAPKRPTFLTGRAKPERLSGSAEPEAEPRPETSVRPVMVASAGDTPTHFSVLQRMESSLEEQQLLHLLLHDTDSVLLSLPQTPKSVWFSTPQHQRVYQAWLALYQAGMPVTPDAVLRTLREQARPDEMEQVQQAFERVLTAQVSDAPINLAHAVRQAAQCRRFSAMVNSLNQGFHQNHPIDELWERASAELAQSEENERFRPFQEQLLLTLHEILNPSLATMGLLTRLTQVDMLTGGLEPSQMYVIGGIQGSGKTALYLELILRLLETYCDVAVLVFSLEMHQKRLQQRLISNLSYVSTRRMKDHGKEGNTPLKDWEVNNINQSFERMQQWSDRVEMHFQKTTLNDIRDISRKFAFKHRDKRKVLVYDHCGLTNHSSNDPNIVISDTIKVLKEVTTEYDYATMPLGQMTKDLENKKLNGSTYHRPDQSFMYAGGFLNQTADTIFCTWRPEMYVDEMEINIGGRVEHSWETKNRMILVTGKNRDGPMNKELILGCNMEFMQLYNLEEEKKYQLKKP